MTRILPDRLFVSSADIIRAEVRMTYRFASMFAALIPSIAFAGGWKDDPAWHDGLVEKATYAATRSIYGKPRAYDAIVFTNKEQHDQKTLTKANGSSQTVEVFKHNWVEVVPTPNYDYKFVTTSHFNVASMELTRLDASSQEFCGTSFKQYLQQPDGKGLNYFGFSYMPEAGRVAADLDPPKGNNAGVFVPEDGLALWLRGFDFQSRQPARFWLLPTQKSNRATPHLPVAAEVKHAGEENGAHRLEVMTFAPTRMAGSAWDQPARPHGTFWMAADRLHLMTRAELADGQRYELKKVERVDYWTIRE
jgi:hypothetical protein